MINYEALFRVSYGIYLVCSGDRNRGNGFISNTVFQVTSEPPQFAASCNKDNFTCGMIEKTGLFSVSVLGQQAAPELFGRFGFKSGKDFNKMEGIGVIYESTGVPIVTRDSLAFLECKVVQRVDTGSHILFIGELVNAGVLNPDSEPMTYAYYRQARKGMSPKNAPTYVDKSKLAQPKREMNKYRCTVCGHIYDESIEKIRFDDLPSDWKCPVCGADKEDFVKE